MVGLIIHDEQVPFPSDVSTKKTIDQSRIAFNVAPRLHRNLSSRSILVNVFTQHGQQPGGNLACKILRSQAASPAGHGSFRTNGDGFLRPHLNPGFRDPGSHATRLNGLRFEHVPVSHQDAALREERHHVRRNQIAGTIQAGLALLRVQFPEPVTNRYVRTDDQHHVGKSFIPTVVHFIENAPRREHPHDGGLSGPRRHLAGVPTKSRQPLSPFLITDGLLRDLDPLPKIRPGFGQKDNRFSRVKLGKEESMRSSFPLPPVK